MGEPSPARNKTLPYNKGDDFLPVFVYDGDIVTREIVGLVVKQVLYGGP